MLCMASLAKHLNVRLFTSKTRIFADRNNVVKLKHLASSTLIALVRELYQEFRSIRIAPVGHGKPLSPRNTTFPKVTCRSFSGRCSHFGNRFKRMASTTPLDSFVPNWSEQRNLTLRKLNTMPFQPLPYGVCRGSCIFSNPVKSQLALDRLELRIQKPLLVLICWYTVASNLNIVVFPCSSLT